eukprot:TRINITY_DN66631_c8_g1_i1.p1 TRINITY_DN66631_c8_g1~~TRINITY_DN66631_c8_g1_i1.p1  ORF type:complete len:139 (-),score=12.03 TRINITY_DN66631_c8_g1_i1:8-424(-)
MDNQIMIGSCIALIAILGVVFLSNGKKNNETNNNNNNNTEPKKLEIGGPYKREEIKKYGKDNDRQWIIIDNKVYDVTDYVSLHPGGDVIINNAGGDASENAHGEHHPPSMWDVLEEYYVGDIVEAEHREVVEGSGLGK